MTAEILINCNISYLYQRRGFYEQERLSMVKQPQMLPKKNPYYIKKNIIIKKVVFFLIVDTRSVGTTIAVGQNMQICHSLRCKQNR